MFAFTSLDEGLYNANYYTNLWKNKGIISLLSYLNYVKYIFLSLI